MSPAAFVAGIGSWWGSWWARCGRNLRKMITVIAASLSGTSAAIAILSFVATHAAAYVHDEVTTQLAPVIARMDSLNATMSALQIAMAKPAPVIASIDPQMVMRLEHIERALNNLARKNVAANAVH